MNAAALLSLALFAPPGPGGGWGSNDALFAVAVEDFVYRTGSVSNFRTVLPADLARLVGCLGCDRYGCRELVTPMIAAHPLGLRAAYWGTHAVDPDLAARSLGLLKRFLTCPHCGGDGYCPARTRDEDGRDMLRAYRDCPACDSGAFAKRPPGFDLDGALAELFLARCLNCDGTGHLLFRVADCLRPRGR